MNIKRDRRLFEVTGRMPSTCFFDFNLCLLLSFVFVLHHSLPWGTLLLFLTIRLKCLCSAHRKIIWHNSPMNYCRKEKMNTSPSILQDKCLFNFISSLSLPLCSIKESGIQTLIRWLRHIRHLSFWMKSYSLPQQLISHFSVNLPGMQQAEKAST